MTHGKTYNKSPLRINHKATRSKTNTGTTALERSVEQTTGGFKALLQLANFTLYDDLFSIIFIISTSGSLTYHDLPVVSIAIRSRSRESLF